MKYRRVDSNSIRIYDKILFKEKLALEIRIKKGNPRKIVTWKNFTEPRLISNDIPYESIEQLRELGRGMIRKLREMLEDPDNSVGNGYLARYLVKEHWK